MKDKLNINTDRMYETINMIPFFVVLILMIVLSPVGVWFFVVKMRTRKIKIYNRSRTLTGVAVFILFLIVIGLYSKIKEILNLISSGMSLDMVNFVPDNIWIYILGIIVCISYFVGGQKLMNQAKLEQKYTRFINLNHEDSIRKLSKKLSISVEDVKENIKVLQNCGYLVPLEIDNKNDKIVYKEIKEQKVITKMTSKKQRLSKPVQCTRCGAIVSLKLDEYVECDFCGHGLIDQDNI